MIYRGDNGSVYELGHATSPDLINWTKDSANPILETGPSGSWDDGNLRGGTELLVDGSTAHLFYRGQSGSDYQIGHATADVSDWSDWTKDPDNPVISPSSSGWDSDDVNQITVVPDGNGGYEGLLSGYNGSTHQLGRVTSSDLTNWTKDSSVNPVFSSGTAGQFDSQWVRQPTLRQVDGRYELLYNGSNGDYRSIGYAVSDDLVEWRRDYDSPVIDISASGWDDTDLRAMDVIHDGSKWVCLYTGYDGSEFAIGKADAQ